MRPLVQRVLLAAALVSGCASTTVDTTGQPAGEAVCRTGEPLPIAVYWGTQWRPDQKEPALREAAALRGIQAFLAQTPCLQAAGVERLSPLQVQAPDDELVRLALATTPRPARVLLVVVRELGPRLVVGIPMIVEGGTEVRVDVRLVDTGTSQRLVASQTLWRHGGTFVIKGVGTLDRDMSAALRVALGFDRAVP